MSLQTVEDGSGKGSMLEPSCKLLKNPEIQTLDREGVGWFDEIHETDDTMYSHSLSFSIPDHCNCPPAVVHQNPHTTSSWKYDSSRPWKHPLPASNSRPTLLRAESDFLSGYSFMEKSYKYLDTISVLFVSVLLISNVVSTKIVDFKWFIFDGGTLLFPFSYIFGDILTEVYGYKRSRKTIWLGFFSAIMMSIIFIIVGKLPSAPGWNNQSAYDIILGLTPRIVIASLIGYASGEFSNSYILAKMKIWTKGKMLWTRTIGSTIVGELVDSILFILIAFGGVLPNPLLITLIISNYIFKTGVEILFTPITYKVVNFLKEKEGEDYYDTDTNFNPFVFK